MMIGKGKLVFIAHQQRSRSPFHNITDIEHVSDVNFHLLTINTENSDLVEDSVKVVLDCSKGDSSGPLPLLLR